MHRLFVGLRPPLAVRERLLAAMDGVVGARWQDDDQLHVTLRFIGEVERPVAEDIAVALGSVHAAPLTLSIDGVGRFERRGRSNSLWAGVRPAEPITRLHRKIDQALVRIGLPPEGRAYLPHITLARIGGGAGPVEGFLAEHAALTSAPFTLDHVLLFESTLGSDGPTYETIARYPLSGA
ncbi:RNA 2',3'-cyclic phosphodiesterase [Sphingomonas qomolangmaensis]|uniref:RNA 2',3'-cyclic phosphodiesterase n=1 Tax=Sphingomonas qomolangmaensis TaxID=2918765 RepID=A0ABY5L4F7_9SPHN|nr:RNA 2',3'-cyclic phosphodiesterase [Sphingomonas qomolangmaensis]UUL81382.1 RNA 2',3'-cyclic phosphodiesterase [Sphingomonas qomolangmaensis]